MVLARRTTEGCLFGLMLHYVPFVIKRDKAPLQGNNSDCKNLGLTEKHCCLEITTS